MQTPLNSLARKTALTLITLSIGLGGSAIQAIAQSKPTISVPKFKNETSGNIWWWNPGTSQELADALSNELVSTGNFQVVERQQLGAVLSEQELAELGLVRRETEAERGQLTGSQYIVLGKVTAYEEGISSKSRGGRISGIKIGGVRLGGGAGNDKQQAYVAIDVRVVDSTSGNVVYTRTVEGRSTSKASGVSAGVSLGGVSLGGNTSEANQTPVGKALRAALIEATDYLSCTMVEQDSCLAEYDAKEQRRRNNDVLKLE